MTIYFNKNSNTLLETRLFLLQLFTHLLNAHYMLCLNIVQISLLRYNVNIALKQRVLKFFISIDTNIFPVSSH